MAFIVAQLYYRDLVTHGPYKTYISILRSGGVGVLPTDTIYGLVGSALRKNTVERIYKLRRRNPKKPMIILIGSLAQLKLFGIKLDKETMRLLKVIWFSRKSTTQHTNILENVSMLFCDRRPTSVVLWIANRRSQIAKWKYLHRGTNAIAFRLPKPYWLRRLLAKTGPLVAPSANPEGEPPARTIREARKYFGDKACPVVQLPTSRRRRSRNRKFYYGVDFYVDAGRIIGQPSKLIRITDGKIRVLRK